MICHSTVSNSPLACRMKNRTLWICLISAWFVGTASAQLPLFPPSGNPTGYEVNQLPRDLQAEATFYRGLQALKEERVGEALESMQELLNSGNDFFLPKTEGEKSSLRLEIETVLREHRDDYERTRDPDHVAAGFPTTCQSCHGATS